jgi:hypothetical protein
MVFLNLDPRARSASPLRPSLRVTGPTSIVSALIAVVLAAVLGRASNEHPDRIGRPLLLDERSAAAASAPP